MYSEYRDAINRSIIAQSIDMGDMDRFLEKLMPVIKKYKKGEYIIKEGDNAEGVIMLLSGEITQLRQNSAGERVIFDSLKPGQVIGEIIIMLPNRKKWASDYIAKTDCVVLCFKKERVFAEIFNPCVFSNKILVNYIYGICRHHENAMIALRSLRNKTVRGKISAYLLELYELYGIDQFDLPYNRTEMAEYLFMPQSSLSREMSKMRQEKIIDYHKSAIRLLNIDALKR